METNQYYQELNRLYLAKTPFLFIIDFEQDKPLVFKLSELDTTDTPVYYSFPNCNNNSVLNPDFKLLKCLIKPEDSNKEICKYTKSFTYAQKLMRDKGVQVINLTKPTALSIEGDLETIYRVADAKYRLLLKDKFVCCSPEIFVRIEDNKISAYPMKGTIDTSIPDAAEQILQNTKEEKEHRATVNELILELEEVATDVEVKRYRYLDKLKTSNKELLQVSSEIVGTLKEVYQEEIGTLFQKMLPAGSIVGAPRDKAYEVIKEVEKYTRGYYTGICGIYDGETIDSFVLIRFIEQSAENTYHYKSGGGITLDSNVTAEYQEILNKIYVPLD